MRFPWVTGYRGRIAQNNDLDYFRVEASAGDLITADLVTEGSTGYGWYFTVTILDASGAVLDERRANTGETVRIQAQVSGTGTYFVRVTDSTSRSDENYVLTVSIQ